MNEENQQTAGYAGHTYSALKNMLYKTGSPDIGKAYKTQTQRNYTKRLLKREKKKYFHNLDTKNYTDNKKFWKTVKPLFSNSTGGSQKIILVNGKEIISNDEEIAKTFNDFFIDSVKSMNINGNNDVLTDVEGLTDTVDIALKKFECHPSILDIKENVSIEVRYEDVMLEVNNLDVKKAGTNIPTKLLKQMKEVMVEPLIWNDEIIRNKKFPSKLKLADITPIFKKLDSLIKKN